MGILFSLRNAQLVASLHLAISLSGHYRLFLLLECLELTRKVSRPRGRRGPGFDPDRCVTVLFL